MPSEVLFRNSERIAYSTCYQKWYWAYVDRLKTRDPKPALRFGTLIHSALEAFYLPGIKRGPRPAETFERLFREDEAAHYAQGVYDEDGKWHEMGHLGVTMLEGYYDLYGKDTRWYVVGTEAPFRVPTSHRSHGHAFTVVGVVDGLWADRSSKKLKRTAGRLLIPYKDLWVMDHKTCGDDPTKKAAALVMDEQPGTYWSYGVDYYRMTGVLPDDRTLSGMLFNFLRKGMPDERPRNELGQSLNKPTKDALIREYEKVTGEPAPRKATVATLTDFMGVKRAALLGEVSKTQPTPLFHREKVSRYEIDGEHVRERTEHMALEMRYRRNGKLPVYKVPGTLHAPHCNWCEFRGMCELHEQGGDYELIKRSEFTVWDPYAQHEILEGR